MLLVEALPRDLVPKRRLCVEWLAYVDDLTVRTGRVLDGKFYTDEEVTDRIRAAAADPKKLQVGQTPQQALEALGFSAKSLAQRGPLSPPPGRQFPNRELRLQCVAFMQWLIIPSSLCWLAFRLRTLLCRQSKLLS